MALLTQKAILSTFEEMLEEMPFDKITVSALVRRCGVSSNTFYYHYQDIYDLLDVWMSTRLGMLKKSVPESKGWKEEMRVFLKYCQSHPKLVTNLLSSTSRSHLEQYIFTESDISFTIMFGNEPPVCRFRRNRSGTLRSSTGSLLSVSS